MRSKSILFSFTTSLGLCALNCSAEDPTLGATGGTSSGATAGQPSALGGTAGSKAGTGGTVAGAASSGGSAGLGTGGSTGGTAGSAGLPSGGAGSGGSAGALSAGAGGRSTAGAAGQSIGGSGSGSGGAGSGGGGMSGAGVTAGSSGSATAGASAGGAASAFAPVADIIGLSCATNACHPNSKGQHSNLHNTDGKLYERLLAMGATITGADASCANLPLVVAGSPETSLIMTMITGDATARGKCGDKMPYKCPDDMAQTVCLTDPEVATIRNWITAGALP